MVIFILPLAMSLVAAVMFALGDYSLATKVVVVALVGIAASLQFVPVLAETVHFIVPLLIQLIVCGWWYVAWQLE